MKETTPDYCDLRDEGTWIDYLRSRLPYSFRRIRKLKGLDSRHYSLSEPVFLKGLQAAEYHNFWRRGNVSYMTGKLLDYFSMSEVGQSYRDLEILELETCGSNTLRRPWPINQFAFYNSMQLEKVWRFAQENHLDRERVMMLNVTQAVELCLKAIMTHANFRETKCFKFSDGHSVADLYADLPQSLRDEVVSESRGFAKEYVAFRTQIETDFKKVRARHSRWPVDPDAVQQAKADWVQIARRISETSYTAFLNSNDPGATAVNLPEDWFQIALGRIKRVEDKTDISVYFRYAPQEDRDELPVDLIHGMLMLGRFMYEHLFPVPPSDTRPFLNFP